MTNDHHDLSPQLRRAVQDHLQNSRVLRGALHLQSNPELKDMTDDKRPTVVTLEPPDKLAAQMDELKRNTERLIEHQSTLAKLRRAAYLAYLAEGFTEAQALELCKS